MSSGPILIFDKSLLEALSVDESVWLGQFYRINMTPLFFVETLADLEKQARQDRSPEQVVERLAEKTSAMTADANIYHSRLCVADLLGNRVAMRRFVVMGGGRPVEQVGRRGVVFDESPEARALLRWTRGEFLEVERAQARDWRSALAALDLAQSAAPFAELMKRPDRPKTLREIRQLVSQYLAAEGVSEAVLGYALSSLNVPYETWPEVFRRWTSSGQPPLSAFAPYAAHVLAVDMFFAIAIAGGHIAKERASNKVDIAYLYYLPFCMLFTSMDRLHARTAPLFMRADQRFIWGADIKTDLRRLDQHFSALPEDVKARGVMSFAPRPPLSGTFLTSALWDEFMAPHWRDDRPARSAPTSDTERARTDELLKTMSDRFRAAPATAEHITTDDADFVLLERRIPPSVGKWRLVSLEVEQASQKRRAKPAVEPPATPA